MRKPRELANQAKYHVTARINRKETLLDPAGTKALFLSVLARAKKRYLFRIHNFTILGNHFHLIIEPGDGVSISRVMQWILSVFARSYNRIHALCGHVWGERFFSRIFRTAREFAYTFDYVDYNPVKAGLSLSLGDWIFSGLYFRRRGIRGIIDPLPPHLAMMLPRHDQLMIDSPTTPK
jgi:putative transposase